MQLEPGQAQPTPSWGLQSWNIFIQQLTQTRGWELISEEYLAPLSAAPGFHPLPQWMRVAGCWCSEQALGYLPILFANVPARGCFPDNPAILIFLPGGLLVSVTPLVYPSTCCISIMPLIKSANCLHIICLFVLLCSLLVFVLKQWTTQSRAVVCGCLEKSQAHKVLWFWVHHLPFPPPRHKWTLLLIITHSQHLFGFREEEIFSLRQKTSSLIMRDAESYGGCWLIVSLRI